MIFQDIKKTKLIIFLALSFAIAPVYFEQGPLCQYRSQDYIYYAPQPRRSPPPKPRKKRISPAAHVRMGKTNMKRGRHSRAIRHFSAALKKDSSLTEAYLLRAKAFDQIGRPSRAVRDYTKYISIHPKDYRNYELRGDAFNFNLEHEKAIEDYNRALRISPDSISPLMGRGLAYMGMEKYDLAIKDYRKALKKRGPTAEIVSNLGLAYMRNDEPKNAVLCFERALEMEKSPRWKEKISKWLEELYQDPRVAKGKTGNKYSIPRHHPSKSLW